MARTLLCEIVTPERILYTSEVRMVVATTLGGEVGILPLHAPLVTQLAPGEVRLQFGDSASEWEFFSISGGYLQVHEDKVIVLADDAIAVSQIDMQRAKESVDRVKELLAELPPDSEDERQEFLRDLSWAETQLKTAEKRGA
ncbi:MAG: ATP synthase F1 subunit epsilon [Actinobacteria bacterium HGW-Actinobacteria-7]|jgi:F-type H+-transporting ATPase subunit epsilon|nr:MAG: ATP synthase F1 subunit epsilon [Actinobacteria bacterium HGW-Actinobacteria-7]